jgi:hypothetical protein
MLNKIRTKETTKVKKSNQPGKTPGSDSWKGRPGEHYGGANIWSIPAPGPSGYQQYNSIVKTALGLYFDQGRQSALEYLLSKRGWLLDYVRPAELPVSGVLLEQWIASYQRIQQKRNK